MSTTTIMFNTVIEPAARRRRERRRHFNRRNVPAEHSLEWDLDDSDGVIDAFDSADGSLFAQIELSWRVGVFPTSHMREFGWELDVGLPAEGYLSAADAAEASALVLEDIGVPEMLESAGGNYTSGSFEFDDGTGAQSVVALTYCVADVYVEDAFFATLTDGFDQGRWKTVHALSEAREIVEEEFRNRYL